MHVRIAKTKSKQGIKVNRNRPDHLNRIESNRRAAAIALLAVPVYSCAAGLQQEAD